MTEAPACPGDDARRALVVEAAAEAFLAQGFAAAGMDAVARAVGMSKKTIYRLFPSKIALFDAVLKSRFFDLALPEETPGTPMGESLARLLIAMAGILLRPDRLALLRLIVVDGARAPELKTAFERLKMEKDIDLLEGWLRRRVEAGELRVDEIGPAARLLFGISLGEPMLCALVGAPVCDEAARERRMRLAAEVFLRGLG